MIVIILLRSLMWNHYCLPMQKNQRKITIGEPNQETPVNVQESQCLTIPFQGMIEFTECDGKKVFFKNNYCSGSCSSVFIPSHKYQYCKACIPSESEDKIFTFMCKNKEITKTVEIITKCGCGNLECT